MLKYFVVFFIRRVKLDSTLLSVTLLHIQLPRLWNMKYHFNIYMYVFNISLYKDFGGFL